jgi:cell division protein FtsN
MTRDYKARRRKAPSTGFSGWTGMVIGLSIGLALAGAIYLKDHRADLSPPAGAKPVKKKAHPFDTADTDSTDTGTPDAPAKSYSFYDMLPKFEVVVPEKEKDVKPDIRAAPETRRGTYVLQTGTYKNVADADRARAQLSLLGIEGNVQKVTVNSDSWLRVRIGPVTSLDELNRLRQLLRKADIDVLLIRVGD